MFRRRLRLITYLEDCYVPARPGLRPGSLAQLRCACNALNQFAARLLFVGSLTEDLLARFLSAYSQRHAAATTNSRRRALLTIWRAAAGSGLVRQPDARRIPKVPEPRHIPSAWTPDEVSRLLASCSRWPWLVGTIPGAAWWTALVLLIYDTGSRISATLQAATADCSLRERWVILRADTSKTREDEYIAFSEQTADALERIYDPSRELLLPWPCTMTHLWRCFRRIVEGAGLTASRKRKDLFHKLRRTSGSLVEAAGGDGARHLRNGRRVFERHYLDPRLCQRGQLDLLPRPIITQAEPQLRLFA